MLVDFRMINFMQPTCNTPGVHKACLDIKFKNLLSLPHLQICCNKKDKNRPRTGRKQLNAVPKKIKTWSHFYIQFNSYNLNPLGVWEFVQIR